MAAGGQLGRHGSRGRARVLARACLPTCARAQVNNCVGQNNQKHFILFLCYTLSLSTYALTMLGIRAVSTVSSLDRAPTRNRPAAILRPLPGGTGGYRYGHGQVDDAGPVFVNCLLFFEVRQCSTAVCVCWRSVPAQPARRPGRARA